MLGVLGTGAVAAIGHNVPQIAASLACRVSRFRETHVLGAGSRPIVAAPVLRVTRHLAGAERGMCLTQPALREACAAARGRFRRVGLVVTRRRRQVDSWLGPGAELLDNLVALDHAWTPFLDSVAALLREELATEVPRELCAEVFGEHAAGVAGLEAVRDILAQGDAEACLLVGIDSCCEPILLEWLDSARVLSQPGAPPTVFGEAAACLLLVPGSDVRGVSVVVAGFGVRPEVPEEDSLGLGLALCTENMLQEVERETGVVLRPPVLRVVYGDMNGDRRRAGLLAHMSVRLGWSQGGLPPLIHPADCLGDVGAATGALFLALACEDVAQYAGGGACVVGSSLPFGANISTLVRTAVLRGMVAKAHALHAAAAVVRLAK